MGPGWVVIAGLAILSWMVVAIARMWIDRSRSKSERRKTDEELSLTTSELKMLIGDAVEDATEPLRRKVDRMERRLPEGGREVEGRDPREDPDSNLARSRAAFDAEIGEDSPTDLRRDR